MQWYYAINGERKGPVSAAEFAQLTQQGVIKPETLVWRVGMAQWLPFSQAGGATTASADGAEDEVSAVCTVSGQRFPKSEMIQYEGKWVSAGHRDEFFQRLREGVAQPGAPGAMPGPYGYGGFWPRFWARMLDGLIVAVVPVVITVAMGVSAAFAGGDATQNLTQLQMRLRIIIPTVVLILAFVYDLFFLRRYDATPGKMALGLKLLQPSGAKLPTRSIIGRNFYFGAPNALNLLCAVLGQEQLGGFLGLVLLIGCVMAAFDPEKRALHDRLCDTRVIRTR